MALKEIIDTSSATQYKFDKLGQTLKGYLVASEEFALNGKMVRKHVFQTPKGMQGVLGSIDLNKKIDGLINQFGLGLWVEATFASTLKTKQPQPMKVFLVKYDDENRVDVGSSSIAGEEAIAEASEPDYAPSEEELTEPEAEEQEPQKVASAPTRLAQAPATVSKEAQSRVQGVLNRRTAR